MVTVKNSHRKQKREFIGDSIAFQCSGPRSILMRNIEAGMLVWGRVLTLE